jgi:hypothetical protein
MKAPFFLLFLLLSAIAAQAQLYLQGTIGKLPAYFQIGESAPSGSDETVAGTYFYEKSLKDIQLQGTKTGKQYNLYLNQDGKTFDERLTLAPDAAGNFTGTWTSKKGKTLPVSLHKIDFSKIVHPYKDNSYIKELRKSTPFDYLRTSFVKLNRDSTTNLKGKTFVWFSETHCDMSLFRLANGFSKQVLETINPKLDSIHFLEIVTQLTCTSYENLSTGSNIAYTTDITYISENLLGFSVFSSYDCGGAHPDFASEGFLIDLHSGKHYQIDEILAFHPSVSPENSEYREKYFAPQLLKLETAAHHFTKPKTEDDCDYTDVELWDYPSWRVTEKGIEFTPIFPRALRACEDYFLVPFSALKPFKNPKFPYTF